MGHRKMFCAAEVGCATRVCLIHAGEGARATESRRHFRSAMNGGVLPGIRGNNRSRPFAALTLK